MTLWTPPHINERVLLVSSFASQRPPTTGAELNIKATNDVNTKGAWVEVLSDTVVTSDLFWLDVWTSFNAISGVSRNMVYDVGIDEAGGTSYSVLIPDVCATNSSNHGLGGGIRHSFPIHIKAGSAIAVRTQSNDSASTTGFGVRGYGRPRGAGGPPFAGKYATTFGFNSGTTTGTSITSGTTSEGSWTSIATSIARSHSWWQLGLYSTDTSLTSGNIYAMDLAFGDASNKHVIIQDQIWAVVNGSQNIASPGMHVGCFRTVPAGANLYVRMQCSGTADSSLSVTVTGIGG